MPEDKLDKEFKRIQEECDQHFKDEFEEWKEWFDSHKEPDGSIILDKHPDLVKWMEAWYKQFEPMSKEELAELMNIPGLGETVNFDFSKPYIHKS